MEKLQEKLKHKDLTSTNLKNFIKMRHPIKKKELISLKNTIKPFL